MPPQAARNDHRSYVGLGAGSVRDGEQPDRTTLHFEFRSVSPLRGDERLGIEFDATVQTYDFHYIQDFYGWFFQDDDWLLVRTVGLWPGLLFGPIALLPGSNTTVGVGVVGRSSGGAPAVWLRAGGELVVTPPHGDSLFDLGFGVYVGVGVDLGRWVALSVRASHAPGFDHGIYSAIPDDLNSVSATLDLIIGP